MNRPKILFYDIETTLLNCWTFALGKQAIRHGQLNRHDKWTKTHIICIAYCWNDGKPAKVIGWGYDKQDERAMIERFSKLIKKADVVIGKNSKRFDDKHINTHMMWHGLNGMPEWIRHTDDLETKMRKYFYLPSYSLDYISAELGLGGKNPMQFADWVNIMIKNGTAGKQSYRKMLEYCKKDIEDTRAIWEHCEKYFELRYNAGTRYEGLHCKHCGSNNIVKDGIRYSGKTTYQMFKCREHHGYAGRVLINKDGKLGSKLA